MEQTRKIKNISGFTLVEILIASAISTVAITMIYAIYMSGNDLWEIKRYRTDLEAANRQALTAMATELKGATRNSTQIPSPNLFIPAVPNNNQITFYLPGDKDGDGLITNATSGNIEWITTNFIRYLYVPLQKQLQRVEQNGQQKNLSNDVSNIQFIDNSMDSSLYLNEVKVILTLNKTTPRRRMLATTSSARIRLRN